MQSMTLTNNRQSPDHVLRLFFSISGRVLPNQAAKLQRLLNRREDIAPSSKRRRVGWEATVAQRRDGGTPAAADRGARLRPSCEPRCLPPRWGSSFSRGGSVALVQRSTSRDVSAFSRRTRIVFGGAPRKKETVLVGRPAAGPAPRICVAPRVCVVPH